MFWRWPEPTVLRVGVRRSLFMILVLSTYMCCVMFAIRREVWSYGPGGARCMSIPTDSDMARLKSGYRGRAFFATVAF